jgi:hypothetical protein
MTTTFGLTVIVYAVGVAAVCALCAVAGRGRPTAVTPALAIVQISVVVQAVLDLAVLAGGAPSGQLAVHVGYLLVSLAILPIAAAMVRLDPGRWGSAALALGCVVVAVVSLRLHQTGVGAHA